MEDKEPSGRSLDLIAEMAVNGQKRPLTSRTNDMPYFTRWMRPNDDMIVSMLNANGI
jgi:hypothetical protein